MENHPRKAGFAPRVGSSIKPTAIPDASVRLSRVETSSSGQAAAVLLTEDPEAQDRSQSSARRSAKPDVARPTKGTRVASAEEDAAALIQQPHRKKWSLTAVLITAVGGLASIAAGMYWIRPRDPVFDVQLITLDGFHLRFCTDSPLLLAVVDVSLTLHINVTNLNVSPIQFSSTIMDIYYRGTLLGQAKVNSGDQAARSSKMMEVPTKLDGLEMTNHLKDLFCDVAKREMTLHSVVTIAGDSLVWRWRHHFEVSVNSDIKVDPIFLDVLEQENRVHLKMDPVL